MLKKIQQFLKITFLLTTCALLAVEQYFIYYVKGIDILYKEIKCHIRKKNNFQEFSTKFSKKSQFFFAPSTLLTKEGQLTIN